MRCTRSLSPACSTSGAPDRRTAAPAALRSVRASGSTSQTLPSGDADLDQRQALGIVVQAVALGVERQLGAAAQLAHGRARSAGSRAQRMAARSGAVRMRYRLPTRRAIDCCIRSKRRRSGSSPSSCVMTYSSPRRTASSTMSATALGRQVAADQLDGAPPPPRTRSEAPPAGCARTRGFASRTPIGQSTDTPMPIGLEILGERLRQADHRVLRGVVDAEALTGDQAGHRGRVDDVAGLTAGDHARHERLDTVDHAPEVDAQHPLPVAVGGALEAAPGRDAGVVAEHVDAAERLAGALGERLHLAEVGDVGAHRQRLAAVGRAPRPPTTSIAASSRSATTTRAPSRASASTSARPIPLPPPVTTATLSLNVPRLVHGSRADARTSIQSDWSRAGRTGERGSGRQRGRKRGQARRRCETPARASRVASRCGASWRTRARRCPSRSTPHP